MKLYFYPNPNWEHERYHYAAEQMMLTLFPGEKPEYPEDCPNMLTEENAVTFALSVEEEQARLSVALRRGDTRTAGERSFPASDLALPSEQVYHVIQHNLKLAFYTAGTELLGITPPWGALTGVRPVKLPTKALKQGATPEQARAELMERYDVTPVRADLAMDCAKASLAADNSLKPNEVSIYVGIPFCPTRCAYCSFVSADVSRTLKLMDPYLDHVAREVEATAEALNRAGLTVRSFYMGGGTPTTLSADQMDRLLALCREKLPLDGCTEYTVEAGRPDTITREKLEVLAKHRIGRISINPQTLEDEVLKTIGRKHSADDIRSAYELAREVGFDCINMDLIAGLPRDNYEGFCRSLEGVLAMDPENVTVHTLALKKGSTLMERRDIMPSGEEVARMLEFSLNTLRNKDYLPYYLYRQKYMSGSLENVGWCKAGTESLYNIVMMEELHTVLSIGGGGVTKLVDAPNGKILRLPNPKYPHDYLAGFEKVLAQKEEIVEFYR